MSPNIELYARPTGFMQYTCPNCERLNLPKPVYWRQATARCSNGLCQRRFRVGLGLSIESAPFALFMGRFNGSTTNRINPKGQEMPNSRLTGPVEWKCPACKVAQKSTISGGKLTCLSCTAPFYTTLLIYSGASRTPVACPDDWIIPDLLLKPNDNTNTHISPATSQDSQGVGASGNSVGENRATCQL